MHFHAFITDAVAVCIVFVGRISIIIFNDPFICKQVEQEVYNFWPQWTVFFLLECEKTIMLLIIINKG